MRNNIENRSYSPLKKVGLLLGGLAASAAVACGGGEGTATTNSPQTIDTKTPMATVIPSMPSETTGLITPRDTRTPVSDTLTPTAELTPAEENPEAMGQILERSELEAELTTVYLDPSVTLPEGACALETIKESVNNDYSNFDSGIMTPYGLADALTFPYKEVRDIFTMSGSINAEQLSRDIEETAYSYIEKHVDEYGLTQEDYESGKETWRVNASGDSSITNPEGCTLSTDPKP